MVPGLDPLWVVLIFLILPPLDKIAGWFEKRREGRELRERYGISEADFKKWNDEFKHGDV